MNAIRKALDFKPGELGDIWAVASIIGAGIGFVLAVVATWLK